jgi:hypothetical protein
MARFEAFFDCGDDDRVPEWCVVEWDWGNEFGSRSGHTAAQAVDEEDAQRIASLLNVAYARSLFDDQECEFDKTLL